MANINLLPEAMRGTERKEIIKAAKKPKIFTIDLSPGRKDKPSIPVKPSKPPRSLWAEIFGRKTKPTAIVKVAPFGQRIDTLPAAKNQNIKYQEVSKPVSLRPQNNLFNSTPRTPVPVKPVLPEKIAPAKPSFELPQKPSNLKVDFKYGAGQKKPGPGFLAWLKKIFTRPPRIPKPVKINHQAIEKKLPEAPKISFELPQKPSNLKVDFKYGAVQKKPGPGFLAWLKKIFTRPPRIPKPVKINHQAIEHKLPEASKISFIEPHKVLEKTKEKYHTAPKSEKSKLDINLIPQELLFRKYPQSRQQIISIILSIIIPALIITTAYMFINQQQYIIQTKISKLNHDKNNLISYISHFKDIQQKNILLQDKLLALDKLLQKHIYWTKFFSLLERYTLDDVYYTEFKADTSGEFMLPAIAAIGSGKTVEEQIADSYRKAANQIAIFKKAADFVSQIKVDNLEVISGDKAGIKGVKFEINLALTNGVFTNEQNR